MEFPDPKYRKMCSAATLQSSKEGFFKIFATTVTEKVDTDWIDHVFSKQSLEKDKIRVCCQDEKVWDAINGILQNVQKVFREKSAKAAKDARLEGDNLLQAGSVKKAVLLYSQSVIRSPNHKRDMSVDDGLTLAWAYKSRANGFYKLRRYDECLTDLHLAMEEGHPEALKYQIYRQMGECYKGMQQTAKAKISLQVTLKLLDEQILRLETTAIQHGSKKTKNKDAKLKQVLETEREEINKLIASLTKEVPDIEEGTGPPEVLWTVGEVPELTGNPNERYPSASKLVSIKQTVEAGRFAAAAENIDTGDTLVVEEPYSAVLVPEMFSSHCHHCFQRLIAPIPCKTCAGLAFCSTQCRNQASIYHQHECQLMGLLMGSGMSVLSFLSLRMITQEGLEFFRKLHAKIEIIRSKKGTPEFTKKESQYIHIYNLTTHSGLRLNDDFFQRALMAIFLVRCLKETSFFGETAAPAGKNTFSEDEILTASIILRHLQLLQFNAHEVYETKVAKLSQTRGAKTVYIGVGIYPTVALFNHECAPSVTRYFVGRRIVIRSVRPHKKDEILSENYGPIVTKRLLSERIRDLTSRYWFRCGCLACVEDWPTLEHLTKECFKLRCTSVQCKQLLPYPSSFKKSETNPRCPRCLNKINLIDVVRRVDKLTTLYSKAIDYMDSSNFEKAVPLFLVFLDKMYAIGAPPHKEVFLSQEALRTCYAQTGNVWVVDT